MEQRYDKETGLPVDRAYLECGLPPYLQRSLDTMKRAWEAEELCSLLKEVGFQTVRITGDLRMSPPSPEEDRWIFHCEKAMDSPSA